MRKGIFCYIFYVHNFLIFLNILIYWNFVKMGDEAIQSKIQADFIQNELGIDVDRSKRFNDQSSFKR